MCNNYYLVPKLIYFWSLLFRFLHAPRNFTITIGLGIWLRESIVPWCSVRPYLTVITRCLLVIHFQAKFECHKLWSVLFPFEIPHRMQIKNSYILRGQILQYFTGNIHEKMDMYGKWETGLNFVLTYNNFSIPYSLLSYRKCNWKKGE